ncbi:MAG: serine/threonine-protein kinase [Myxococcota bacterium]
MSELAQEPRSEIGVSQREVANAVRRDRLREALFGKLKRPRQIGRFEVLGTLGRGGMGVVLEALDPTLDRPVALKVLNPRLDRQEQERLLREAQAMAKLSHPNVVQVYEAGEVEEQTFIAMELIEGMTLDRWMRREPPPGWRECVEVFVQAGVGLAAAHERGLVHRDFKPSNAIVDDEGRARVLDFGLARRVGTMLEDGSTVATVAAGRSSSSGSRTQPLQASLTRTGAIVGTPAYMPPEQMKGEEATARSDQFSFCVALWEAVYGERPFEGNTLLAVMVAIKGGAIRPVPKGSTVPVKLRAILRRGLAPVPVDRWPSMNALLEQLRRLVAPRRPWLLLGVGVTAGLTAVGGGLAYQARLDREAEREREAQRCRWVRTELEGIWDDGRKQAVRDAILGTGLPYAPYTWERVEPRLSDYANAWTDERAGVCEAEPASGEAATETTLVRIRCLGERKTAMRATVDVLAGADGEVAQKAVDMVTGLPRLERCDDLDALLAEVPPPEDPEVARQVQELRDELADAVARHHAGKYAESLRRIEPLVDWADALGYGPLQAEIGYRRGVSMSSDGQYVEAEMSLRTAHGLALEHGHTRIAIDAAQSLTRLAGNKLERYAEGLIWGEVGLAQAKRTGDDVAHAECLIVVGTVLDSQGSYEKAELELRRGVQMLEEALPADDPRVASSRNNLGVVLTDKGDYEEAELVLQRAVDAFEQALGADHPQVAAALHNLGNAVRHQGRSEQAELHYRRALRINEEALGRDHPEVATSLHNIGNVLLGQGEYEQAELHFQRALQIKERALGADHPSVALTLVNQGLALFSRGEFERAKHIFERALLIQEAALGLEHADLAKTVANLGNVYTLLAEYEQAKLYFERAIRIDEKALGPEHPNLALSSSNLGTVCLRLGEHEEAERYYQRALRIGEKALGPEHPNLAYPLEGLAEVALDRGEPAAAREPAERMVSIREAATVPPEILAKSHFMLARILWHDRTQRVRAREIAEQARDAFAKLDENRAAEVTAWLAKHRLR